METKEETKRIPATQVLEELESMKSILNRINDRIAKLERQNTSPHPTITEPEPKPEEQKQAQKPSETETETDDDDDMIEVELTT